MATEKKKAEELQKRIAKTKAEARERVVKRGLMHFRADEEMMEQLMAVAAYRKLPVSSMVRSWVAEQLRKELAKIDK
jgi:hypothetical protein